MPGQTQPPHDQFRQQLSDIERRLQGVEHQQQMVITDPTGGSGDPAHGHAVMVTGSLQAICGIAAFGCAVWSGSAWVQVPTGLVLSGTALLKANDLSDLHSVVTALTNLSAPGSPTAGQRIQILWGAFGAGSTSPGGTSSGGFTVSKTAVGQYLVTFATAFADTGYVFLPGAAGGYTDFTGRARGSVTAELRSTADALSDLVWTFVALGVY